MKEGIHPKYRDVVFYDVGANFKLLTRSTVPSSETIEMDGKQYPVVKVEISSASHPFYTGQEKFLDAAGRVEKFQKKFGGDYFKGKKK
jgi:large subunit ribosomal protein L31